MLFGGKLIGGGGSVSSVDGVQRSMGCMRLRRDGRVRTSVVRPFITIACISPVTFSRESSMKGMCADTADIERRGM